MVKNQHQYSTTRGVRQKSIFSHCNTKKKFMSSIKLQSYKPFYLFHIVHRLPFAAIIIMNEHRKSVWNKWVYTKIIEWLIPSIRCIAYIDSLVIYGHHIKINKSKTLFTKHSLENVPSWNFVKIEELWTQCISLASILYVSHS